MKMKAKLLLLLALAALGVFAVGLSSASGPGPAPVGAEAEDGGAANCEESAGEQHAGRGGSGSRPRGLPVDLAPRPRRTGRIRAMRRGAALIAAIVLAAVLALAAPLAA